MERIGFDSWEFRREGGQWENVTLPHTAHLEPEVALDQWEGWSSYRKKFHVPEDWRGKCLYFSVGGAMQRTKVRLNGQYLFTHLGGYDRWVFGLTDLLRYGCDNELEFELDNRPCGDMPPGKPLRDLDFCYYGGLYRDAALEIYSPVHITDESAVSITAGGGVFVRTLEASRKKARVEVRCHVLHEVLQVERHELGRYADETFPCRLKMRLLSATGKELAVIESAEINLRHNCDHTFCEVFELDRPKLWSPDSPQLHHVECTLFANGVACDSRSTRFGIRTIEITREHGCRINGEKVDLIGTNRHQDYPYVGNAVPEAAQRRDAAIIRRAGYNLIRLAHYHQHRAFVEACDELGMLVIPCIPGWQIYHANDAFFTNAFRDVKTLVRQFRNHPACLMWEVSLNETYPPCWVNDELHRTAHAEYPGPNFYTCGDVLGFYEGWDVLYYRPGIQTDKPILMREYGDWGFGGNQSTSRRRRGDGEKEMLQQTWNFLWSWNRIRSNPLFLGGAHWAMFDYNRGYHPDIERSGDADIYRVPRYKYYFFMSQSDAKRVGPMVFIAAEWKRKPGPGKIVVFSNCDEVELFLNGRSLGRRRPDSGPDSSYSESGNSPGWETAALWSADGSGGKPFDGGNCRHLAHPPFTFDGVEFEPGTLRASGFIADVFAATAEVHTPGRAARLALQVRDEGVPAAPNDLLFVDVRVLDAAGHAAHAERPIRLEVENGEIIGETIKVPEAGIASFLIRPRPDGTVTLSAKAAGLFAAKTCIRA